MYRKDAFFNIDLNVFTVIADHICSGKLFQIDIRIQSVIRRL